MANNKISTDNAIDIEIAYGASSTDQTVFMLSIAPNTTAKMAIEESGILTKYPEIALTQQKIGVFGRIVSLNYQLKDGDRVEIYRPLTIDPKTARRQRALKKNSQPTDQR